MNQGIRCLAFSTQEYGARLSRVQAAMELQGLDVLLIHHRAQLCYVTGMENCSMAAPYAALVPARGEPTLVSSGFEMLNAEATSWCEDRVTFKVGEDPLQALACLLKERGYHESRIGVQLSTLTAEQYIALREFLPHATWLDASALLPHLMLYKTVEEAAHLREAGRLSTIGMAAALDECASGKMDNDVAASAYSAMVRGGSEFMCLQPIVTVGERSGIPHSTFRRTRIKPGDAVFIEVAGCFYRYSAPLMRTASVAPVPDEVRRAGDACRDSLSTLIENMKPGVLARDAALKAKAAWTPLCNELIWHGIYGYSVGLGFLPDWNDAPVLITEQADWSFEPGMCFHVTTSLRSALRFGTAMSETVLVTDNGNEILTATPRELHVV